MNIENIENQLKYKDFIESFPEENRWDIISKQSTLSIDFFRTFKDKINWNEVKYFYYSFPNHEAFQFFHEFKDYINWQKVSGLDIRTHKFLFKAFAQNLNWERICEANLLSDETVDEFAEYIDFDVLIVTQIVSDYILLKYHNKINWNLIKTLKCYYDPKRIKNLLEKINQNKDKVN